MTQTRSRTGFKICLMALLTLCLVMVGMFFIAPIEAEAATSVTLNITNGSIEISDSEEDTSLIVVVQNEETIYTGTSCDFVLIGNGEETATTNTITITTEKNVNVDVQGSIYYSGSTPFIDVTEDNLLTVTNKASTGKITIENHSFIRSKGGAILEGLTVYHTGSDTVTYDRASLNLQNSTTIRITDCYIESKTTVLKVGGQYGSDDVYITNSTLVSTGEKTTAIVGTYSISYQILSPTGETNGYYEYPNALHDLYLDGAIIKNTGTGSALEFFSSGDLYIKQTDDNAPTLLSSNSADFTVFLSEAGVRPRWYTYPSTNFMTSARDGMFMTGGVIENNYESDESNTGAALKIANGGNVYIKGGKIKANTNSAIQYKMNYTTWGTRLYYNGTLYLEGNVTISNVGSTNTEASASAILSNNHKIEISENSAEEAPIISSVNCPALEMGYNDFVMTGGDLSSTNSYGVKLRHDSYQRKAQFNGGNISGALAGIYSDQAVGRTEFNGISVTSEGGPAIFYEGNGTGTVVFNNGLFYSSVDYAAHFTKNDVFIKGGIFESGVDVALYGGGTSTISVYDGSFIGKNFDIEYTGSNEMYFYGGTLKNSSLHNSGTGTLVLIEEDSKNEANLDIRNVRVTDGYLKLVGDVSLEGITLYSESANIVVGEVDENEVISNTYTGNGIIPIKPMYLIKYGDVVVENVTDSTRNKFYITNYSKCLAYEDNSLVYRKGLIFIYSEYDATANAYVLNDIYQLALDDEENLTQTIPQEFHFEKNGYRLKGFSSTEGGAEVEYSFGGSVTIATDRYVAKLYAVWEYVGYIYTVEHYQENANDDEYTLVSADTETIYGTGTTEATAKSYEGFAAQSFDQTTITEDGTTVVKIYYDRNRYTITFDMQGGVGGTTEVTVKHGQTNISGLVAPTKAGYTFNGYYPQINGGGSRWFDDTMTIDNSSTIAEATVYAYWTERVVSRIDIPSDSQNQSYEKNDAFVPFDITAIYDNGDTETVSVTTDMLTNFDTSTLVDSATATVNYAEKTATFTYSVEAKKFTVTYDVNGATGTVPSSMEVAEEAEYTLPSADGLSKTGYTFGGWSDGETTYAAAANYTMPAENVEFTAVWKLNAPTLTVEGINYDPAVVSHTLTINYTGSLYTITITPDHELSNVSFTYAWYRFSGTGVPPAPYLGEDVISTASGMEKLENITSTLSVTNVTDSGWYYCYITAVNGDETNVKFLVVDLGIEKADQTITLSETKFTYSEGLEIDFADYVGGTGDGTLSYAVSAQNGVTFDFANGVASNVTKAGGTFTLTVTKAATDNYNAATQAFTITLNKQTVNEPTIASKAWTGATLTADVLSSELYTVTTNNGGTAKGSYDVVLTLEDANLYKWATTDEASVTLSFAIVAMLNEWTTDPSINGWTYGQSGNAPIYEAKYGNSTVVIKYRLASGTDADYTTTVPTNAGAYKVRFTVAATEDYGGLSEVIDLTIAKANPTVSSPTVKTGLTYTSEAQTLITAGSTTGGTVQYKLGDDGEWSANLPTAINAGTYKIYYKVVGDSNYNDADGRFVNVTIAKKNVTVTAENKTVAQFGTMPEFTYTVEGVIETNYTFDTAPTVGVTVENTNAHGTYTITVSGGEDTNYSFTYVEGTLTITEHPHNYSKLQKSETEHWNECSCGEKSNKAAHADGNGDGKCDACDCEIGNSGNGGSVVEPPVDTDPPVEDPDNSEKDEAGLGTGAIVAIVICSVAGVGGGGFALYWFVIRKKKVF